VILTIVLNDICYSGILDEWKYTGKEQNIFEELDSFINKNKGETIICFISYDLKNHIEKLNSNNPDKIDFPTIHCLVPKKQKPLDPYLSKENLQIDSIQFQTEMDKPSYLNQINKIKTHIQRGDFYEANFCYEWWASPTSFDPIRTFNKLNKLTAAPYAVYADLKEHIIISASPELFLKKRGDKLYSSPIKGTQKRVHNTIADNKLKKDLEESEKDITENTMIVDLVRNDLSKIAKSNSVKVEELCKVYTFKNIHQMISTISCRVDPEINFSKILTGTFPMGSMTGAPKIRVMKLMEEYEKTKRGLYSGTIGVIQPNGDFDFNVIIRTLLYNKQKNILSFHVGGAITDNSNAELEYEETLIKADALFKACQS